MICVHEALARLKSVSAGAAVHGNKLEGAMVGGLPQLLHTSCAEKYFQELVDEC